MKDYIQLWTELLAHRPQRTIPSRIEVTGERNKHLGPKMEYASVSMALEPSDNFEVVDEVQKNDELRMMGYPDWFIFGLLDAFMASKSTVLTRVKVILQDVKYDRVDSSPNAFREAGRDAGRKVHAALK